MNNNIQTIEDIVYTNPQLLLSIKEGERIGQSFLPYSTGIEIECHRLDNFDESLFKNIPDILAVNCSIEEQRFRIPSGLKGLICLKEISNILFQTCAVTDSGNHYHIDWSDIGDFDNNIIEKNSDWVLDELDTWGYNGTYNPRKFNNIKSGWICYRSEFKSVEFRIGEMVFDYEMLSKRIIHANDIIRRLKNHTKLNIDNIKLMNLLNKLKKDLPINSQNKLEHEISEIVNNRIIKWNY